MTREQAESELMQIYGSLSEEKKKALDVAFKAMEQAIPVMYYPQVDGITPTVVAQADGEYILKKDVMGCIGQTSLHWELARKLRNLPSVAIPSAEPYKGMTNGEVIKAMFGDDKVSEFMGYARIMARVGNWFNDGVVAEFDEDWWNSPYDPQESEDKE